MQTGMVKFTIYGFALFPSARKTEIGRVQRARTELLELRSMMDIWYLEAHEAIAARGEALEWQTPPRDEETWHAEIAVLE